MQKLIQKHRNTLLITMGVAVVISFIAYFLSICAINSVTYQVEITWMKGVFSLIYISICITAAYHLRSVQMKRVKGK